MTEEEKERIELILGRKPTEIEAAIYDVMWSEHCSYKSSILHIRKLFKKDKGLVEPGEENAGGFLLGKDLAVIFKMESHNHPSAVEPFQGAATGVGGILRDIFAMGARPIALLDSLHFGSLSEPKARFHLDGVVRGISYYANCIGVPTVGGETHFHPSYITNPIVNIMAVGVCSANEVIRKRDIGSGFPVLLAGAKTGRDGYCGASFASQNLKDKKENRFSIQIADPFLGKLLMEFTLELNKKGLILQAQDLGAGGIATAAAELAARCSKGILLEIEKVPLRQGGLDIEEILLSESQERMLFVVSSENVAQIKSLARKYEIEAECIGILTEEKTFKLKGGSTCNIPVESLIRGKGAPVFDREFIEPSKKLQGCPVSVPTDPQEFLLKFAKNPNICSKRWIYEQYDQTIGTNTVVPAGGGAAVVRIKNTRFCLALSVDSSAFYSALDPFEGAKAAVAEGYRNIIAIGATPIGLTDSLNFPTPEEPEKFYYFVKTVEGIKQATERLGLSVFSGNVSFYNESEGSAIIPTPVIGTVGFLDSIPILPFISENDLLIVVGETRNELNGSVYQLIVDGKLGGIPPAVDLEQEKRTADFIRECITWRLPSYISDISTGGVMKALLELMFQNPNTPIGIRLVPPNGIEWHIFLFSESQARYLVAIPKANLDDFSFLAEQKGIPFYIVGEIGGDTFRINEICEIDKDKLRYAYHFGIHEFMGE